MSGTFAGYHHHFMLKQIRDLNVCIGSNTSFSMKKRMGAFNNQKSNQKAKNTNKGARKQVRDIIIMENIYHWRE